MLGLAPIVPINHFSRLMPIDKIAIIAVCLGAFWWFWGAVPSMCAAIMLLLYGDGKNWIQPFKITLLATEKTELFKCEYFSIRKCLHCELVRAGLKRCKV